LGHSSILSSRRCSGGSVRLEALMGYRFRRHLFKPLLGFS